MKIEFCDNKINGKSRYLSVQETVAKFHKWLKTEHKNLLKHYPFERAFLQFMLQYEVDGLKFYGSISDELMDEVKSEYDRQL